MFRGFAPLVVAASVACLALVGCDSFSPPPSIPVSGVVILDGQPVENVTVLFMPVGKGDPGRAVTGPDGTFAIKDFQGAEGIPAGQYDVVLKKPTLKSFPEEYASPDTTPLTWDISDATDIPLSFELESQ